ncbi:hypothetical protein V8C44DRAFT_336590 [Trichoderma aethiopicum]
MDELHVDATLLYPPTARASIAKLLLVDSVHFLIQSPRLASPCPSPLVPHFEPEAGRQMPPPMPAKPCLAMPLCPCLVSRFFSLSDAASAINPCCCCYYIFNAGLLANNFTIQAFYKA